MEVIQRHSKMDLLSTLVPTMRNRFYAEIITRAGSKHDPSTNTGLAHYLEHLLFKGHSPSVLLDFEKENHYLIKSPSCMKTGPGKPMRQTSDIYEEIIAISTKLLSWLFQMKWIGIQQYGSKRYQCSHLA